MSHVTFGVQDLSRSFRFYGEVLGMQPVARWDSGAYLVAGELWVALLADPEGRAAAGATHVAFTVDGEEFERLARRIRDSAARVWKENVSEGPSLYFEDPSGHRLEIHASDLAARLRDGDWQSKPGLQRFDQSPPRRASIRRS